MLRQRCPAPGCGANVYSEDDIEYGHTRYLCLGGHSLRYVDQGDATDPSGFVTSIRVADSQTRSHHVYPTYVARLELDAPL